MKRTLIGCGTLGHLDALRLERPLGQPARPEYLLDIEATLEDGSAKLFSFWLNMPAAKVLHEAVLARRCRIAGLSVVSNERTAIQMSEEFQFPAPTPPTMWDRLRRRLRRRGRRG